MLSVMLGSTPNLDFPIDMQGPSITLHMVRVATLDHARTVCLRFIAEHDLGGGNWIGGGVQSDGGHVARVHYNGRIEAAGILNTAASHTFHGLR